MKEKLSIFSRTHEQIKLVKENLLVCKGLKFVRVVNIPRANGAKRCSGRKPGERVTNFVLAEFKVVARGS